VKLEKHKLKKWICYFLFLLSSCVSLEGEVWGLKDK
jgi:hypothetical protein